jgi:hypothetical protein
MHGTEITRPLYLLNYQREHSSINQNHNDIRLNDSLAQARNTASWGGLLGFAMGTFSSHRNKNLKQLKGSSP